MGKGVGGLALIEVLKIGPLPWVFIGRRSFDASYKYPEYIRSRKIFFVFVFY